MLHQGEEQHMRVWEGIEEKTSTVAVSEVGQALRCNARNGAGNV